MFSNIKFKTNAMKKKRTDSIRNSLGLKSLEATKILEKMKVGYEQTFKRYNSMDKLKAMADKK